MYFRLWASASSDEALPVVIIELPLLLPPYSRLFGTLLQNLQKPCGNDVL